MNKIEANINFIKKAKGSCFYKYKNTSVVCSVDFNNKHEQSKIEDYEKVTVDVKYRNINNKSFDEYYSAIVKEVLSKCILNIDICKSVYINLIVDSIESNTLWCSINAMFLGLIECGIPLHTLLYASTGFTSKEDTFLYNNSGDLIWYHAFCDIKEIDMQKVFDFYKYVKEIQNFTCKTNLSLKNI